ncbi:MAG: hypothetical protein M0P73_01305 [Syntrophobacterales bacterium]|jgi:hypothetical protein|nr:hypothetical protein [Syntrophobacterales bacterium]
MVKHYLMDLDYFTKIGVAPVYALEGCSGFPNAVLVAEEETWKSIEDGDHVAYHEDRDVIHTGFISFAGDNIILHSFSPDLPDKVLSHDEIKRCDRIRTADFRDDALKLQTAELKMFLKNFLGDLCPLQ